MAKREVPDFNFWEKDFPADDERRSQALQDNEVRKVLYRVSPSERTVSGDALLEFQRLLAHRYGLDNYEADKLLEVFWLERDRTNGYQHG